LRDGMSGVGIGRSPCPPGRPGSINISLIVSLLPWGGSWTREEAWLICFLPATASVLSLFASARLFARRLNVRLAAVVVSSASICLHSASFLPLAATRWPTMFHLLPKRGDSRLLVDLTVLLAGASIASSALSLSALPKLWMHTPRPGSDSDRTGYLHILCPPPLLVSGILLAVMAAGCIFFFATFGADERVILPPLLLISWGLAGSPRGRTSR